MTNDERSRLDVIEAKVDTILLKLEYVEARASDHEDRIRGNEKWKYAFPVSITMALAALFAGVAGRF